MSFEMDSFKESVYKELEWIKSVEDQIDGRILDKEIKNPGMLYKLLKPALNKMMKSGGKMAWEKCDFDSHRRIADDLIADPALREAICDIARKHAGDGDITDIRLVDIVVDAIYASEMRKRIGEKLNARDYAFVCYRLKAKGIREFCSQSVPPAVAGG